MALNASVREVVARARSYIQDRSGQSFSDALVLQELDSALESLNTLRRLYDQNWQIDRLDLDPTLFVQRDPTWFEYADLPEYVGEVKYVDAVLPGGRWLRIEEASGSHVPGAPVWSFTGPGSPGTFSILGRPISTFGQTIRVWFVRRYPALTFSNLAVSAENCSSATATSCVLPLTASGVPTVRRNGVYEGMRILFETSGQIRQVTGYDGATRTISWVQPLSPVPNEPWSWMFPLDADTTHVAVLKVAHFFATMTGNRQMMDALTTQLQYHEDRFGLNASQRSTGAPRRVHSSRER